MAHYKVTVIDPDGRVLLSLPVNRTLVELDARTDLERSLACLREMPTERRTVTEAFVSVTWIVGLVVGWIAFLRYVGV
jgi:hypothetical protein